MRLDKRRLHVVDRLDCAAELGDAGHLLSGALGEFGDETLHDRRAFEDVRVLEQVGLEGEDLLQAQRPLLVPLSREAECLVPGRELERPGADAAAERHGEGLQGDPVDVVLRLGFGEAERVDLDAVAEAPLLFVLDAVAVTPELVPQLGHRAELGVLLDEADPGVDEERDPPEHTPHQRLSPPTPPTQALADRVEHRDRIAHRVGDLLNRRGAGLLEVVGADVDRVPLRDVLDRVDDRVGDQPHARSGRERVGAPTQVLLEDVVLRRALKLVLGDSLIIGGDDVERQQPGGGRVDRHRRIHLVERDPVDQCAHVTLVRD